MLINCLTPFNLMDFITHIDTLSMDLCILYLKGSQVKFLNFNISVPENGVAFLSKQCRPCLGIFTVCQSTGLWVSSIKRVNMLILLTCS